MAAKPRTCGLPKEWKGGTDRKEVSQQAKMRQKKYKETL
jgi:hypothetical protein